MIPDWHHTSVAEFRHLTAFLAVAEHLSFRGAAEHIGVGQPSLSKQIQQLEERLGARLFERDRRTVRLTAAGSHLLERLPDLIGELGEVFRETRAVGEGLRGVIRLGCNAAAMTAFLPPVFDAWELDDCELELTLGAPEELLASLRKGRLDCCFVLSAVDDPELVSTCVGAESVGVVVPSTHRLAERDAVRCADLEGEVIIPFARELDPRLHDEVMASLRREGFAPVLAHVEATRAVAVGLAAAGQGVALLSSGLRRLVMDGCVYRPLVPLELVMEHHLVVHRHSSGRWLTSLRHAAEAAGATPRP